VDEAIVAYQQSIAKSPDFIFARTGLALAYAQAGRLGEARTEAKEVLRINPKFSLEHHGFVTGIKDPALRKEVIALLNSAGLK
jgi:tetratricopeptide (TPR) repeat protein